MIDWHSFQDDIQNCKLCEEVAIPYLQVPLGKKCNPPWTPLPPVRIYFVSVAPPWGGAYFWDESKRDAVREGLFAALRKPLGITVTSCYQFCDLRLFLTPAVKCPSSKNDKDHRPSRLAIRNCAKFLHDELLAAEAERILALGKVPFKSLCSIFEIDAHKNISQSRETIRWVRIGSKEVPLLGTYFAGNNRHKGFSCIENDIARLLELTPRATDALPNG